MTARSLEGSWPTSFALTLVPFWNWTLMLDERPITCWLVRMSPLLSMTNPVPSAAVWEELPSWSVVV